MRDPATVRVQLTERSQPSKEGGKVWVKSTRNMKKSEEYPAEFARAIADVVGRISPS